MKTFKVGDRVRVKNGYFKFNLVGAPGTVVDVRGKTASVEFDKFIGGHDCNGHAKWGYGWWLQFDELNAITTPVNPLKIYMDGAKVKCTDGITTGVARCHPDDEFDFMVGAKLALERYDEAVKAKSALNCKVVCVDDTGTLFFTAGKVYELKNGKFVANDFGWKGEIVWNNIDDLNKLGAKFIKFIEE